MDEQFKKRLVGSLIFISLAIIFFPWCLMAMKKIEPDTMTNA